MNKFVINKGIDNEFTFTIKKNGSIEAININVADTFVFKLKEGKTGNIVYTVAAVVADAINGKIMVSIPTDIANGLAVDIGDRCDYYKRKVTYRASIECSTVDNGKFVAKLDKVYVE